MAETATHGADYRSLLDAIRGVLLEACSTLEGVQYVVAGGWVPFLRGDAVPLRHPGTHDVDLLFNDDLDPIRTAVTALIAAGYVPSAKHPFQMLKKLPVDGRPLVFNIDLMHPVESQMNADMFQDILDLGVTENYDPLETHIIKSISLPSAKIVFEQRLWSRLAVEGVLPTGESATVPIPLIDEVGLILSKCESVKNIKRPRDSFDIYYLLASSQGRDTASRLRDLSKRFPQVGAQLAKLREFLMAEPATFDGRVADFAKRQIPPNPAAFVLELLF